MLTLPLLDHRMSTGTSVLIFCDIEASDISTPVKFTSSIESSGLLLLWSQEAFFALTEGEHCQGLLSVTRTPSESVPSRYRLRAGTCTHPFLVTNQK